MAHAVVATAYGGPEVLDVVEVDPGEPGPGEVLLEVRAAGVNPTDWKSYSGAWGTDVTQLPIHLGREASGVVIAIGEAVDTVLVHGASGGVGAMIVQLARAKGARVIGTADPSNHEYLVDLGAVPVGYGPGLVDRVRAAAHGTLTSAIDVSGTREALNASVTLIRDRRRIATIAGYTYGAALGIKLLGKSPGADPGTEIRMAARAQLIRLVEAGRLTVRVGATYPLVEAARAHRAGIEMRVQGKIILVPGQMPVARPAPSRSLRLLRRGR